MQLSPLPSLGMTSHPQPSIQPFRSPTRGIPDRGQVWGCSDPDAQRGWQVMVPAVASVALMQCWASRIKQPPAGVQRPRGAWVGLRFA